jgi:hypothetical protein
VRRERPQRVAVPDDAVRPPLPVANRRRLVLGCRVHGVLPLRRRQIARGRTRLTKQAMLVRIGLVAQARSRLDSFGKNHTGLAGSAFAVIGRRPLREAGSGDLQGRALSRILLSSARRCPARKMRMSGQATNYVIVQLEELGYLERRAPRGCESPLIHLTRRGRQVVRVIQRTAPKPQACRADKTRKSDSIAWSPAWR